jgi:hypothetical protein
MALLVLRVPVEEAVRGSIPEYGLRRAKSDESRACVFALRSPQSDSFTSSDRIQQIDHAWKRPMG